jgi:deoxyadenosine/deoxycytidine kinase
MQQNNHKIITIVGNVGAGKSTLLELLGIKLGAFEVAADELFKINPIFPSFVTDMKRWALPNELWFLFERVKMIKENMVYLASQDLVIDSGLLMMYVYAYNGYQQGYFTDEQWQTFADTYELLTKDMAKCDVVVNLKASVPFLLGRITKRGREYEIKNYTEKYVSDLDMSLKALEVKLKNEGTRIIDFDIEKMDFMKESDLMWLVEQIKGGEAYAQYQY